MKKTLLFLFFALTSFALNAQSIGIIGSATPTGWDSDTDMATTDNITYTLTMTFVTGEAKFRQDDAWTTNWGSNTFPTGTGTQNGPNIPVAAGTYTVTFNRITGEYSFEGESAFDSVGIIGTVLGPNGFDGADVDMMTTDGINYILSGYTFETGEAKFRQNDAWTTNWGSSSFPSGTATLNGPNIPVQGGTYTVTFNKNTGDYNFGFVSIGIIGSAVNGWDQPDADMVTTDGVVYMLDNYVLNTGEFKFRQDDSWTFNWGTGGINPDVLVPDGQNIPVEAGTYDIMFNRNTLEFSVVNSLGIGQNSLNRFSVYPNPSATSWNFASSSELISTIELYDLSGKLLSVSTTPSVDATQLSSGVYFAKVKSGSAAQTIKVVKL